jgi:hypothetical protein
LEFQLLDAGSHDIPFTPSTDRYSRAGYRMRRLPG